MKKLLLNDSLRTELLLSAGDVLLRQGKMVVIFDSDILKKIVDFSVVHQYLVVEPSLDYLKQKLESLIVEKELHYSFTESEKRSDLRYQIKYGKKGDDLELYGQWIQSDSLHDVYAQTILNIEG